MAGLIDAEGSVSVTMNQHRGEFYASLRLANTDLNLLDWVQERFGGARSVQQKRMGKSKAVHRLYWIGADCYQPLTLIQPYVIVKYELVRNLITLCEVDNLYDKVRCVATICTLNGKTDTAIYEAARSQLASFES